MAYDETNRGKVWPAKEKKTDKHPDFDGSQNVCCPKCGESTDYWVSAWRRKEGANPKSPALSWSIKPKDGKPMDAPRSTTARPSLKDEMGDSEIPF